MELNTLSQILNSLRTDLPMLSVEQWKRRVLEIVTQQVCADKANFISQFSENPAVQLTQNTQPEFDIAYEAYYHTQDPLGFLINGKTGLQLVQGPKASKTVVSLSDVVARDDFRKTEYYNDFLCPMHIYHELILYLKSGQHVIGIISVMRNSEDQFTLLDYEFLRLLEPYLSICMEHLYLTSSMTNCDGGDTGVSFYDERKIKHLFQLSRREIEVVGCIFQGMTNAQIGESLFISEFTVKKHIQNICSKMKINRRTAIVSTVLKGFGLLN